MSIRDDISRSLGNGPAERPSVYIPSSAKNIESVRRLTCELRLRGYEVYDWTALPQPLEDHLTPEEYKTAIGSEERLAIQRFCVNACMGADVAIYYGPSGQDAAAETALAYACGASTLGLAAPGEKPGLILDAVIDYWCKDETEIFCALEAIHRNGTIEGGIPRCRVCGCTDACACIDQTGGACFWIEPDLCSSCAEKA